MLLPHILVYVLLISLQLCEPLVQSTREKEAETGTTTFHLRASALNQLLCLTTTSTALHAKNSDELCHMRKF